VTTPAHQAIQQVLQPLSRLNAWARLPLAQQIDMSDAAGVIYRYKRSVIRAAIRAGIAQFRIVAVDRPCKTCKGTGTYIWINWHDEDDQRHEDCRRCGATGIVTLRFVESNIGGFRWHTPRPKWDLGVFDEAAWGKCEATDWAPERPGAPLEFIDLTRLLNQVERVIFQDLIIPHFVSPKYYHQRDYSLNLGTITECWICGANPARAKYKWGHDIYRPGLRWKQLTCEDCEDAAYSTPPVWPAKLDPRWTMDERRRRDSYPPWQDCCLLPDIAKTPEVIEWLARRGIVPGYFQPGSRCCAANGTRVEMQYIRDGMARVTIYDEDDWLYVSPYEENAKPTLITVPADSLVWWHRYIKQPPVGSMEAYWESLEK
jgi:hypothetical protein